MAAPFINYVHSISRPTARRGFGTVDLIVSFTLLMTVISIAAPLVARHAKLLRSQRNYRLALDELSNQMDRLTALPFAEIPTATSQLSPSAFLVERLPGAKLSGQTRVGEDSVHITLQITWDDVERSRSPVALSAWVFDQGARSETAEEAQP